MVDTAWHGPASPCLQVRAAVSNAIPLLCEALDIQDVSSQVLPLILDLVSDEVAEVRRPLVENLMRILPNLAGPAKTR